MSYYRIHSASESLETLLDTDRPDGWVASDETRETQPRGISCCGSVADLMRYVREYSMAIQPGDVLVRLEGSECDEDRDEYARRVEVESYRVAGADAAQRLARLVERRVDPDRVESLLWYWS